MKRVVFALVATAIVAGAGLAVAQSTPDSTHVAAPPVTPPPVAPPPVATPPLRPRRRPSPPPPQCPRCIATAGSQGSGRSRRVISRTWPGTAGRAQIFGEGSLGFITTRSEVKTGLGSTSNYDYYFGTNAGVGVKLGAGPAKALLFDATYNWVFATGTDPNYLALRGAIMIGK